MGGLALINAVNTLFFRFKHYECDSCWLGKVSYKNVKMTWRQLTPGKKGKCGLFCQKNKGS